MLRHLSYLTVCLCVLCSLSSCDNGEKAPDVSDVKVSFESYRLDRDLVALDTNRLAAGLNSLHRKYPDFLDFYFQDLLGYSVHFPYVDTMQGVSRSVKQLLVHPDCHGLVDTIAAHYPDTKTIDADVHKGLQYLKHYDSTYRFSKLIYITLCLNDLDAFTYGDDIMAVNLDMFLGREYPNYERVGIAKYLLHNAERKDIVPKLFKRVYQYKYPFVVNDRDLLDLMLQKGKEQYFLSKVVPFVADSVRFGFTGVQLDWCKKNEAQIYNFLVQQKLIYEKNQQKVVRYVLEGPGNAGLPEQSPGHVGVYTGYRIIEEYMHQHPGTSMKELFNAIDDQSILQGAHYNPR